MSGRGDRGDEVLADRAAVKEQGDPELRLEVLLDIAAMRGQDDPEGSTEVLLDSAAKREQGDPEVSLEVLLDHNGMRGQGDPEVSLEVLLDNATMRRQGDPEVSLEVMLDSAAMRGLGDPEVSLEVLMDSAAMRGQDDSEDSFEVVLNIAAIRGWDDHEGNPEGLLDSAAKKGQGNHRVVVDINLVPEDNDLPQKEEAAPIGQGDPGVLADNAAINGQSLTASLGVWLRCLQVVEKRGWTVGIRNLPPVVLGDTGPHFEAWHDDWRVFVFVNIFEKLMDERSVFLTTSRKINKGYRVLMEYPVYFPVDFSNMRPRYHEPPDLFLSRLWMAMNLEVTRTPMDEQEQQARVYEIFYRFSPPLLAMELRCQFGHPDDAEAPDYVTLQSVVQPLEGLYMEANADDLTAVVWMEERVDAMVEKVVTSWLSITELAVPHEYGYCMCCFVRSHTSQCCPFIRSVFDACMTITGV